MLSQGFNIGKRINCPERRNCRFVGRLTLSAPSTLSPAYSKLKTFELLFLVIPNLELTEACLDEPVADRTVIIIIIIIIISITIIAIGHI